MPIYRHVLTRRAASASGGSTVTQSYAPITRSRIMRAVAEKAIAAGCEQWEVFGGEREERVRNGWCWCS